MNVDSIEAETIARNAGWIPEIEYNGEDDGVRHPLRGDWAENWQGAVAQERERMM